jgi:host factor-I protein
LVNKQQSNLQDIFLNNARKNKLQLTIHLINGFQLKGFVKGFDNFTVILECDNKQMLIYKHSISTITPIKPILFADNE